MTRAKTGGRFWRAPMLSSLPLRLSVLIICALQGSIARGVRSCSSLSPAQISPPPLPRTSMIKPSCGIDGRVIKRMNSFTN